MDEEQAFKEAIISMGDSATGRRYAQTRSRYLKQSVYSMSAHLIVGIVAGALLIVFDICNGNAILDGLFQYRGYR